MEETKASTSWTREQLILYSPTHTHRHAHTHTFVGLRFAVHSPHCPLETPLADCLETKSDWFGSECANVDWGEGRG